jgi:hypothetical protein
VGETSGQIETEIRSTRDDLNANLSELEHKVKSATDWRQQFQKSPGTFLAVAAGAGLLLALLTNGRKAPPAAAAPLQVPTIPPHSRIRPDGEISQSLGIIKSALIGVAASKATSALARLVPGFEDHLTEARRSADGAVSERTDKSRRNFEPPQSH